MASSAERRLLPALHQRSVLLLKWLCLVHFYKTLKTNLYPWGCCFQRPTTEQIKSPSTLPSWCFATLKKHHPQIYMCEHIAVLLERFECHQQTRLRWRTSRMASAAMPGVCMGKRVHRPVPHRHWRPSARRCPADCGFHAWLLQKRWWRLEQMAKVPAVARPRQSPRKLKEEKKKHETTWLLPLPPFVEPRIWDVTGVCVMENWKGAQMAFLRGGGVRAHSAAGKRRQLVDWYQNLHSGRHSFIMLAGCCPATCQIGCPTPSTRIHPTSEMHYCELWSKRITANLNVCSSVCVRLRQDGEAVEDQREGQASRGLQPEGWGRTDQEPLHHHFLTGKRLHNSTREGWTPSLPPPPPPPGSKCQTESGEELWVLTPLGWDSVVGQEVKNRQQDQTFRASGFFQTFGDIKTTKNHYFHILVIKKNNKSNRLN